MFYVHIVVYKDFPNTEAASDYLGVDLGNRNIATDSDGNVVAGEVVDKVRTRYAELRQRFQAKGSRSAKRKLKHISGKEPHCMADKNHCISKALVESPSSTDRGLAIEDLKGIRERMEARKVQRMRHHSWALAQLGEFLSYKCAKAEVHLVAVNPRYTSQTCDACGHRERANRTGDRLGCHSCGYADNADANGAKNISAAVNLPNGPLVAIVACVDLSTHSYKPTALVVGG